MGYHLYFYNIYLVRPGHRSGRSVLTCTFTKVMTEFEVGSRE